MQTPKRGIWIATGAVVLAGLVALVLTTSPSERERRGLMGEFEVGDDAARVIGLLGEPPARCEAGALEHLRSGFPEGWPPAAIDVALQQLSAATSARWVYPVDTREPPDCSAREGRTEVGIGADQRVLWFTAITGKTTVNLPPTLTPAGPDPAGREP